MKNDERDLPACTEHGPPAGIVTNQPEGHDPERVYAATRVCGDPSCRAEAMAWVWQQTGEHGTYVSDKKRKAATA